jgi:hypothetical protein
VLNLIKLVNFALLVTLLGLPLFVGELKAEPTTNKASENLLSTSLVNSSTSSTKPSLESQLRRRLGITYFSFFYGPGLHPDHWSYNPNQLALPENDGMYFQNNLSLRYKFSPTLAVDFQTRVKIFVNNAKNNPDFSLIRWEAPRIGISGRLMSGEDWILSGAINTDFPYFFPEPFSGMQAKARTVLLAPGMFASFKYEPKRSRWSVFSVLSPRIFIYKDHTKAESQFYHAGNDAGNKPELILALQPTLNYRLTPTVSLTAGSTIEYRKQVYSDWNPFNATVLSNGNSRSWRLNALPATLGVTWSVAPSVTLFPFISAYPIAAQRVNAKTGNQASFWETVSVGMWLSGTII